MLRIRLPLHIENFISLVLKSILAVNVIIQWFYYTYIEYLINLFACLSVVLFLSSKFENWRDKYPCLAFLPYKFSGRLPKKIFFKERKNSLIRGNSIYSTLYKIRVQFSIEIFLIKKISRTFCFNKNDTHISISLKRKKEKFFEDTTRHTIIIKF